MRLSALLLVGALLGGCQPSELDQRPPTSGSSATEPIGAAVQNLPAACRRWQGKPSGAEISFAKDGRLFALDPDSHDVRCIGRRTSYRMSWGAQGDRLLLTSGRSSVYSDSARHELPGDQRETTWSRPTGTSVVYVSHDFNDLLKEEIGTGEVTDISFLEEHHDVTYHPAGTHIAVSGTRGGEVGLFLATNEGTEVQQIVRGEEARFIDGLAFSHDGRHLYFRGDHGDHHDLHAVRLATGEQSGDVERELSAGDLKTIDSGDRAGYFAVSPFSRTRRILYAGGCRQGDTEAAVLIRGQRSPLEAELGAIDPVGWLPDHSVTFLAYGSERCDESGKGDLYRWHDGTITLLVTDVDAAAVRAVLPDPPDPPARSSGVVA